VKLDEIQYAIVRVIRKHKEVLAELSSKQSAMLELAGITGLVEHYKSQGSKAVLISPKGKPGFVVKTSTRGEPWNFSRFSLTGDHEPVELHMNMKVRGAHDPGVYCVDLAIIKASSVPDKKPASAKWECLDNNDLITFGEVKKLVIYPMLLAQFIGIVHELKPACLKGKAPPSPHIPPALIVLGAYSSNSQAIVTNYSKRKILVTIAENYDLRLARVRSSPGSSPFLPDTWY